MVCPAVALGLGSTTAGAAETPSENSPAKITAPGGLSALEAAFRHRDRLKPLQAITDEPPPLAPHLFSPDPDRNRLPFRPSPVFPEIVVDFVPRVTYGGGPPPLSPSQFNPDPPTGPASTRAFTEELERVKLELSYTPPPLPKTPAQFNPDPGARPVPAEPPLFQREFTLALDYGTEPVPPPLALPRGPLRQWDEVAEPPVAKSGPEPAVVAARWPVRTVETVTATEGAKEKFGLADVPAPLKLPRARTRRNLPFHPHFESSGLQRDPRVDVPPGTESANDRWRVGFLPWRRYTTGSGEDPFHYHEPRWWHPYYQSRLKGDLPVIGQDIFLNLTAASSTEFEGKRIPIPSGVSAATPGQAEFFGRSEVLSVQNNLAFAVELFRGETVFKPVEWAVKFQPVYNINYVNARETGVVSPDPRGVLGAARGTTNHHPTMASSSTRPTSTNC